MTAIRAWQAVFSAALLIMMGVAGAATARAAEFRGGPSIMVAAGETIQDDLYATGDSITINGTIDGDLFAAGLTVVLNGRVTGSLFAAAQTIVVNGRVDGDVRTAGQTITLNSLVGGDVLAAGDQLAIGASSNITRDLFFFAAEAVVNGPVGRNVRGGGGAVTINAPVGGSVELQGVEQLTLGPEARISGPVSFESRNEAHRESGAQASGGITRRDQSPDQQPSGPLNRLGGTVFNMLAVTVLGAAALLLSPRGTAAAGLAVVQRSLLSLAWGFGLFVAVPLAALLICLTFVGIPLAVILLIVFGIVLYATQAIVALGIGRLLLSQLRPVEGYGWSVLSVLVGALILAALRSVPVLDAVVTMVMLISGLGAIWLVYLDARTPPPSIAATEPSPTAG